MAPVFWMWFWCADEPIAAKSAEVVGERVTTLAIFRITPFPNLHRQEENAAVAVDPPVSGAYDRLRNSCVCHHILAFGRTDIVGCSRQGGP